MVRVKVGCARFAASSEVLACCCLLLVCSLLFVLERLC
jgi:hypothetical protein